MTEKLAIGVDVGGTNTVTGLVDTEGKTHGERSFKTREYPYFEDYVERLVQDIESLRRIAPGTELAGIGIGVPNGNYFSGVAENPINIRWYERNRDGSQGAQILTIPFVETVKKHYPSLPVVIDNDANAAAIGEMIYGGARGMRDFIEITLGTGLGGGIVANGEMVYGYGGPANSATSRSGPAGDCAAVDAGDASRPMSPPPASCVPCWRYSRTIRDQAGSGAFLWRR